MEDRIVVIEAKIASLEKVKDEFYEMKNSIVRMEMVDNNIYDKLAQIDETMKMHKDNFILHDKNEMEKYGSIDARLKKIERVIYMAIGAALVIEFLSKMHFLNFGGQ